MQIEQLTKAISDQTRLRLLMLLVPNQELCVCEFTQALDLSQPKISRHLAILREADLLQDRKSGLWVYYRLNPALPEWVMSTLDTLQIASLQELVYQQDVERLRQSEKQNQTNCL